jgi:hypothetical protein
VDHLYASYTAAQDCIGELDAREQRLRRDRTLLTTRSAETTLNVTDQITAGFSTTYWCLPDTVDPRGPKGKWMPELLAALDAFLQEHRRCGELESGV